MEPDEMLTEIRIPMPWGPINGSYRRLAWRSAVDFPLVNAAGTAILDKGKVESFRVVVSALGPAPITLREPEAKIKGAEPIKEMVDWVGEAAKTAAEGAVVANTIASKEYRASMAEVTARRVCAEILGLN
jgi:CO/xanthine dehydrogenase FAD-binding subunit